MTPGMKEVKTGLKIFGVGVTVWLLLIATIAAMVWADNRFDMSWVDNMLGSEAQPKTEEQATVTLTVNEDACQFIAGVWASTAGEPHSRRLEILAAKMGEALTEQWRWETVIVTPNAAAGGLEACAFAAQAHQSIH